MSQSSEQFLRALAKAAVKPAYLICGQEPLLVQECADALRAKLKADGFSERIVLESDDSGFDWDDLYQHASAMSLFASQRLIDLRLPSGKPGKDGSQAIADFCARAPSDTVLLVTCQEWSAKHGGKWSEAIEQCGQMVVAWQVKPHEMDAWLNQRLASKGITASSEALQILLACVEGNLLAANQEVAKLAMQGVTGAVSAEQMQHWVADSSRFDVFKLIDACYAQDLPRMSRILHGLKAEGEQVPGLVPMLGKELMSLAYYAQIHEKSRRAQAQMQADRQWQSKQAQMLRMLDMAGSAHFESLIQQLAAVDKMSKGRAAGDAWVSLHRVLAQWAVLKIKGRVPVCV
jgi:DNA polymerase-3 subunit delta